MSLFWRIFALNAVVLGTATGLLLWAPVTVSVPVLLTEAVILVGGLVVMLVANAALLRLGLAPLDRLTKLMTTVDLLRPGQRLPASGGGEVAEVIRTFNAMLERLEHGGPPAAPVPCWPRRPNAAASPRSCTTRSARS